MIKIIKNLLSFSILGTEKNPRYGNHWTRRPSSESSWGGDITFVSHSSIQPFIHPSIGFKVFFTSFQRSWRPKRCSVPSLLVTVWTVLSTSPRWWARVQRTLSPRPGGKVILSFFSLHVFFTHQVLHCLMCLILFEWLLQFMNIFFATLSLSHCRKMQVL